MNSERLIGGAVQPRKEIRRARWILLLGISALLAAATGRSQLRISGQASSAFLKADAGYSQYAINAGRATFAWRLDLFADAEISDHISFLSNVRLLQDQIFHVDLLALRLADIASSGLTFEAGEIELPFGSLGERRFPWSNPFYSLPLMNEHLTSLRSSDYELWPADARYTFAGNGVRLLDRGLYDLGVKVYGGAGIMDFWIALTNGMVSASSAYSSAYSVSSGLNAKSGLGTIFRVAATPVTGLTIGSSYATGPFLSDDAYAPPGSGAAAYRPGDVRQHALEGDVDFSYGHCALAGEVLYNLWTFGSKYGDDLKALGYSLEGRYTPLPRVTVAARAGGLHFNEIPFGQVQGYAGGAQGEEPRGKWDHDVVRLEGALGYRLDRSALLKLVYAWNRTQGLPRGDPADNLLAVQMVVNF